MYKKSQLIWQTKGGEIVPVDINYTAVLGAAILSMVLGFIWYSPTVFGKQWLKLKGLTPEKLQEQKNKGMEKIYAVTFLSSLVMAYVLAHFVDYTQAKTLEQGAQTGFWIWLGFVATVMLAGVLFGGKSFRLYLIESGYHLASLIAMSALLAIWV